MLPRDLYSEDFKDFLQAILDSGVLKDPAAGITRLVINKDRGILSEKQRHVFAKYVWDIYVTDVCTECSEPLYWHDMWQAYLNGGYCSDCVPSNMRNLEWLG